SHVTQRRPRRSAHDAVVPEPQVRSKTSWPGAVVMWIQRSITSGRVWTAYTFGSRVLAPELVSVHRCVRGNAGKSSMYRLNMSRVRVETMRRSDTSLSMPAFDVFQ